MYNYESFQESFIIYDKNVINITQLVSAKILDENKVGVIFKNGMCETYTVEDSSECVNFIFNNFSKEMDD